MTLSRSIRSIRGSGGYSISNLERRYSLKTLSNSRLGGWVVRRIEKRCHGRTVLGLEVKTMFIRRRGWGYIRSIRHVIKRLE